MSALPVSPHTQSRTLSGMRRHLGRRPRTEDSNLEGGPLTLAGGAFGTSQFGKIYEDRAGSRPECRRRGRGVEGHRRACAFELAVRARSVTILEREELAAGASGRNTAVGDANDPVCSLWDDQPRPVLRDRRTSPFLSLGPRADRIDRGALTTRNWRVGRRPTSPIEGRSEGGADWSPRKCRSERRLFPTR